MKKVIKWLKESNRYKHLIGGVLIGAGANSLYCAAYAGIGVATALELKDRMWGGKADIIDWGANSRRCSYRLRSKNISKTSMIWQWIKA